MIHETADIHPKAQIASDAEVWHYSQVREYAIVGAETHIGRQAYIDHHVIIGSRCKIQNGANLYFPAILGCGVFVGPGVTLANDAHPRAIDRDTGDLLVEADWHPQGVILSDGVSVGAGAVIMPGVEIGEWAVVGAQALVLASVPKGRTVFGIWKGE